MFSHDISCVKVASEYKDTSLNKKLNDFWEFEDINQKSASVVELFRDKIKFDVSSRCYEVELPFKNSHEELTPNYNLCVQRLNHLTRKLKKDQELLHDYNNIVKEQLSAGILKRLTMLKVSQEYTLSHTTSSSCTKTKGNHKGMNGV